MKEHTGRLGILLAAFWSMAAPSWSAHILFYHNSRDGSAGTILKCAAILRDAGHQVTLKDVQGKGYDPTQDNWGHPFDQVWDLRFVNEDPALCGSGRKSSPDHFTQAWRSKSVSFLNHCGRLFLAAENFQLTHRNEGIYPFLRQVGAVAPGFETCGPSPRGNNVTEGPDFYPVRRGFGPVSFFGALTGGIPLEALRGTSFVETFAGWEGDSVNRSIASGWSGRQLSAQVDSPDCAKGKLFMVWDASMWPLLYKEGVASDWEIDLLAGRDFTRRFFPAVVNWLGSPDCPCRPPVRTLAKAQVPTPIHPTLPPSSAVTPTPARRVLPFPQEETLTFQGTPVNIRVRYLDGPGVYRLEVHDAQGRPLRTLFDRTVTLEKEAWTSWDGLDAWGIRRGPGSYFALLSKEGRPIRRIRLNWVGP